MKTLLNTFNSNRFNKKASKLKITCWFFIHALFFSPSWIPFIGFKIFLLRSFGAKVGRGLVIKPSAKVKYPWNLVVGDDVWIGEESWIDNLDVIEIGNNVCISQGALLLTGNHNYTVPSFDFRNAPIKLEDGVWIGAQAVVCPGVICKSHSILTVGSIATKDLLPYSIYQGNPAVKIRERVFSKA